MGKKTKVWMTWVLLVVLLVRIPMQSTAAEIWDDLKGESTINSKVYTQDGTRLWTKIQTNYHAGGIAGLVVQTPANDVSDMMSITSEEAKVGDRPLLYVGGSMNGEKFYQLMKDQAATLGGKALYDLQINLFRWWESKQWMETYETTSKSLTVVMGIEEKDRQEGYNFALIHYYDGNINFLYDTDADVATLTVDLSDFRGTYMVIQYPSSNSPVTTGSTEVVATGGTSGSDEFDAVPKTGDVHIVTLAVICMASLLVCVAAVVVRKKMA